MSRKKSTKPLHKHTLNLYEGDYEVLQQAYPELGGAIVIRDIIRAFIVKNQLELQVPSTTTVPSMSEVMA